MNREFKWGTLLTLEELNKKKITLESTIEPKPHIIEEFYRALGTTEDKIKELSNLRLNKLAGGYFLANYNPYTNECRDTTTNFRIPNHYHVEEIHDQYITITRYPNMREGYKEVPGLDISNFENTITSIKLKYSDFNLIGSCF